jgi:hypothetical protein
MDRRSFVAGTAASAAALAAGRSYAQGAYPSHAITMISPFPPGGVSDTITRPLDAALEVVLKQPVVLENPALPRSTSCSAARRNSPMTVSFHWRALSPIRS